MLRVYLRCKLDGGYRNQRRCFCNASSLVNRIRSTSNTPVAVGLGVSTKEQAKVVASYADGVIVGSAFIKIIQENGAGRSGLKKIKKLAQSLSEGVRDGR